MTPQDVLDAIVAALTQSTAFDGGDYITEEIDAPGANSRLKQPVVELQFIAGARAEQWNTDRVGYTTDDSGNRTGEIFEPTWEDVEIQADIRVAAGNAQLDATELGGNFERALYRHDSQGPDIPLPDGAGGTADGIEEFLVGDGRRQDDLAGPGIRRWRHDLTVTFTDRVTTDTEYVEVVETPTSGTASGGDDVAIELTVSN
ncbi:hypothetical protein ACFQMF_01500 [Halorubrum rutilum]|uniref:Uncharacterized protein n=1 Tax=Halorubrum rutilum TaxID=1364933 RepID=A0ABD6AGT1_9EURY|nr:hypothetical protein [Halorubrum rutilum]